MAAVYIPCQTALVDFLDDLLTFVEEKIAEAIADPASQLAATQEAAGAMPVINDRLREDNVIWLKFDLVLGVRMEARHWRQWWDEFARMERADFLSEAGGFVGSDGMLAILRTVLRQ